MLQKVAGKDATKHLRKFHRDGLLVRHREKLKVGVLRDGEMLGGIFSFLKSRN